MLRLSHDTHILVTLVLGTFNIGVLISYDTDYAYLFRLLVLLLPAGGAVLGKWLDGSEGGLWGLAIGFVLGFALAALSGWLLMRMKEE